MKMKMKKVDDENSDLPHMSMGSSMGALLGR